MMPNIEAENIPAHVPAELVFDFDLHLDPRLDGDPHAGYQSLHRDAPDIFFTPRNGGHWVMTRLDDITDAMFQPDLFSSAVTAVPTPPPDRALNFPPLEMDNPEHRKYRNLVNKFLAPSAIKPLEAKVRAMAIELIEEFADHGKCDYVDQFSTRLPVGLWMTLMDMDLTRRREFIGWVHILTGHFGSDERIETMGKVTDYFRDLVEERAANPGSDPVSFLIQSEVDGEPLSRQMVRDICNLLFTAGLDTVTNAMSFMTRYLAENPDRQRELRDNPDKIPAAVEEFMRRFSLVSTGRVVTRDAEFRGVPLKKGDVVLAPLPAGSLDDRRWECPMKADFDRPTRGHLGFNTGPHNCAGSHLARMELRVTLEEWLKRIPEFRLAPGHVPGVRKGQVLGLENLELVW
ncbi:MAG: cytochrome P450 [Sphingomonadaceae bacterium]